MRKIHQLRLVLMTSLWSIVLGCWLMSVGCSRDEMSYQRIRNATAQTSAILDLEHHDLVLTGVAQGSVPTKSVFGDACSGFIGKRPSHAMEVKEGTAVNITVKPHRDGADLNLVITGKSATYCNDDREGLNPGLQVYLTPGTYQIFVGTHSRTDDVVPFTLNAADADPFRPFHALSVEWAYKALQRQMDGRTYVDLAKIEDLQNRIARQEKSMQYDVPTEAPSMHPRLDDLRVRQVLSVLLFDEQVAGNTDAPLWPLESGCSGYADKRGPELRLQVSRNVTARVQCEIVADRAVQLAIQTPSGSWQCKMNHSSDARWTIDAPAAGAYLIFVTTLEPWNTWGGQLRCNVQELDEP